MTADPNTPPRAKSEDEGGAEDQRDSALARRQVDTPQAIVSPLKSMQLQVGEHVVRALQIEHCIAVLTTVIASPDGSQSIISMPLDEGQMSHVQQLLAELEPIGEGDRVPCVGFHCYLPQLKKNRGGSGA